MHWVLAVALVLTSFATVAQAQDPCAPLFTNRCAVLPPPRAIPRFRPASPGPPALGTPSHRAAAALDRAWTLVEALPSVDAPVAVREARDALTAIVAQHAHLDGLALGNLRDRWPTAYAVRLTIAELSWRIDDLDACVEHFERLSRHYPDSDNREDGSYAALLCHARRLAEAHSGFDSASKCRLKTRSLSPPNAWQVLHASTSPVRGSS